MSPPRYHLILTRFLHPLPLLACLACGSEAPPKELGTEDAGPAANSGETASDAGDAGGSSTGTAGDAANDIGDVVSDECPDIPPACWAQVVPQGLDLPLRLSGTIPSEACSGAKPTCGKYESGPQAAFLFQAPEAGRYRFRGTETEDFLELTLQRGPACDATAELCSFLGTGAPIRLEKDEKVTAILKLMRNPGSRDYVLEVSKEGQGRCFSAEGLPELKLGSNQGDGMTGTHWFEPSCITELDAVSFFDQPVLLPERLYQFTAPKAGRYAFDPSVSASVGATVVFALKGDDCDAKELACSSSYLGAGSARVELDLEAGETRLIGVELVPDLEAEEDSAPGPFSLNVSEVAEPQCPKAQLLTGAAPISETIAVSPQSDSRLNCDDWPTSELAYTFKTPKTGKYLIEATRLFPNFDAEVTLRINESACDLTPLACKQGFRDAAIVREFAQDELVHVRVGLLGERTNSIELSMTEVASSAESCDAPAEVTVGDNEIVYLGSAVVENVCGGFFEGAVARFVPGRSGVYQIEEAVGPLGLSRPLGVAIGDCKPEAAECHPVHSLFLEAGQPTWIFARVAEGDPEQFVLNLSELAAPSCSEPYEPDVPVDFPDVPMSFWVPAPPARASEVDGACAEAGIAESVMNFMTKYEGGTYRFSAPNADEDAVLYVLDGTSCLEPPLACELSQNNSGPSVDVELGEEQTVTIVLETTAGANTPTQLQVALVPPSCENMRELLAEDLPDVFAARAGGENQISAGCSELDLNESVYRFQAPQAGPYVFELGDGDMGSLVKPDYRAVLYALSVDCDGEELACEEGSSNEESIRLELMLEADETVAIVVEKSNGRDDRSLLVSHSSGCAESFSSGTFDPEIEQCVCRLDEYCCTAEWDYQCVDEVVDWGCGGCSDN